MGLPGLQKGLLLPPGSLAGRGDPIPRISLPTGLLEWMFGEGGCDMAAACAYPEKGNGVWLGCMAVDAHLSATPKAQTAGADVEMASRV